MYLTTAFCEFSFPSHPLGVQSPGGRGHPPGATYSALLPAPAAEVEADLGAVVFGYTMMPQCNFVVRSLQRPQGPLSVTSRQVMREFLPEP